MTSVKDCYRQFQVIVSIRSCQLEEFCISLKSLKYVSLLVLLSNVFLCGEEADDLDFESSWGPLSSLSTSL